MGTSGKYEATLPGIDVARQIRWDALYELPADAIAILPPPTPGSPVCRQPA
ncbi:hypothetical protein ACAX43_19515 [Paraburkholderia sp. IW21]|uniref:hypothetical protein n=1 Tax=Paraburkholderia sp. IW21 TaxID=3242488 RepID=UPI00352250F0